MAPAHFDVLRHPYYRRPLDDDERAAYESDEKAALMLLQGFYRSRDFRPLKSKIDLQKRGFLSARSTPSENEARRALCRILQNAHVPPSRALLHALADTFEPLSPALPYDHRPLRAILKKRSQGHADFWRDMDIYWAVKSLRDDGKTLEGAAAEVGDALGIHADSVKKIIGRLKRFLGDEQKRPMRVPVVTYGAWLKSRSGSR